MYENVSYQMKGKEISSKISLRYFNSKLKEMELDRERLRKIF